MSSTYISADLRRQVVERAKNCCEYCLMPQHLSLVSFAIDHIIAEKHGGKTHPDNLALSCPICNRYKGSDIASIDSETGRLSAFYHPRTDTWREHFSIQGALFSPLSGKGRVTIKILQINRIERVAERALLIKSGLLKPIQ
ncbi:MAG: HNH endonuclease signature motif containing protein [Cyanobacteria bacterium J06629_19]